MGRSKPKNQKPPGDDRPLKNSDLTDDESRALFLQYVGEIDRTQKKKRDLVNPLDAQIKLARKKAKADGFPKEMIDDALRQRDMEPDQVQAEIQMRVKVARWTGKAPGYQPDMFSDMVDRTPVIDRAYEHGKEAGMAGDDFKCPDRYAPGSDTGQAWMRGWKDGQQVLASAFLKRKPADVSHDEEDGAGMDGAEGDESVRETEDA